MPYVFVLLLPGALGRRCDRAGPLHNCNGVPVTMARIITGNLAHFRPWNRVDSRLLAGNIAGVEEGTTSTQSCKRMR
jgi:hypothetical protein